MENFTPLEKKIYEIDVRDTSIKELNQIRIRSVVESLTKAVSTQVDKVTSLTRSINKSVVTIQTSNYLKGKSHSSKSSEKNQTSEKGLSAEIIACTACGDKIFVRTKEGRLFGFSPDHVGDAKINKLPWFHGTALCSDNSKYIFITASDIWWMEANTFSENTYGTKKFAENEPKYNWAEYNLCAYLNGYYFTAKSNEGPLLRISVQDGTKTFMALGKLSELVVCQQLNLLLVVIDDNLYSFHVGNDEKSTMFYVGRAENFKDYNIHGTIF